MGKLLWKEDSAQVSGCWEGIERVYQWKVSHGADKVPISSKLWEEIKLATPKYKSRLAQEKREKAAEESRREDEVRLALKRKEREEAQATWEGKMKKTTE